MIQRLKDNIVILLILLIILLLAGYYTWQIAKDRAHEQVILNNPLVQSLGTKPDETPYVDLSGQTVVFNLEAAEVLVVNSWATWSPDSPQELRNLVKLSREYADSGVRVVAINRSDKKATAQSFLKTLDSKISTELELVFDDDDRFFQKVSGFQMPQTIFYDRGGNVFHHHNGAMTEAAMRRYIDAALAVSDKE